MVTEVENEKEHYNAYDNLYFIDDVGVSDDNFVGSIDRVADRK